MNLKFLIYSNLFVAICIASLLFEMQYCYTGFQRGINLLVVFSVLLVYNVQRMSHGYKDEALDAHVSQTRANKNEAGKWIAENKEITKFLVLMSGGFVLLSVFSLKPSLIFSLIPVAVITFFYGTKIHEKQKIYLKKIPFVKPFLLAGVVAFVLVFVPYLQSDIYGFLQQPEFLYLFLCRFFLLFSIAMMFDIRDVEKDGDEGTKTIPVVFGSKVAHYLVLASLLLAGITEVMIMGNHLYLMGFYSLLMLSSFLILKKDKEFYYSLGVDSWMLLHALLGVWLC